MLFFFSFKVHCCYSFKLTLVCVYIDPFMQQHRIYTKIRLNILKKKHRIYIFLKLIMLNDDDVGEYCEVKHFCHNRVSNRFFFFLKMTKCILYLSEKYIQKLTIFNSFCCCDKLQKTTKTSAVSEFSSSYYLACSMAGTPDCTVINIMKGVQLMIEKINM